MDLILYLVLLLCLPGVCYALYKFFLLIVSPDAYRDTLRYEHERDMARRARNRQALGLFGVILNLFR